jgi:hypothetical protein
MIYNALMPGIGIPYYSHQIARDEAARDAPLAMVLLEVKARQSADRKVKRL